jgi:hypothetical protein
MHSAFFFVYLSVFTLAVLLVMEGETLYEHHRSLVGALTEREWSYQDTHIAKVSTSEQSVRAQGSARSALRTPEHARRLDSHSVCALHPPPQFMADVYTVPDFWLWFRGPFINEVSSPPPLLSSASLLLPPYPPMRRSVPLSTFVSLPFASVPLQRVH